MICCNSNLPTFWKNRKSVLGASNVGELAERRHEIDMLKGSTCSNSGYTWNSGNSRGE